MITECPELSCSVRRSVGIDIYLYIYSSTDIRLVKGPRQMANHLSEIIWAKLTTFIQVTASAWMDAGLIKQNTYGVEVLVADDDDFENAAPHMFGTEEYPNPDPVKNIDWYRKNAHGKNLAAIAAGMDSHEAVRLWQGALSKIEGVFPWGGAVIDLHYGICVGVSGFAEDEDILFARTIRNYLVKLLDREGQTMLDDARERGQQEGDAAADRFTRVI